MLEISIVQCATYCWLEKIIALRLVYILSTNLLSNKCTSVRHVYQMMTSGRHVYQMMTRQRHVYQMMTRQRHVLQMMTEYIDSCCHFSCIFAAPTMHILCFSWEIWKNQFRASTDGELLWFNLSLSTNLLLFKTCANSSLWSIRDQNTVKHFIITT